VDAASLDAYLAGLAARADTPRVSSPYRGPQGNTRLDNLRTYLQIAAVGEPAVALVGEAPGYRGCAVTGIPFTSRSVLAADLGRWGLFAGAAFQSGEALGAWRGEATATVVWRCVAALLPRPPLVGNAFPFHPHPGDRASANRGLTAAELVEGVIHLRRLLALVPGVRSIAVGRRAEQALRLAGAVPIAVVRHPAHGGAAAFAAGLAGAAARLADRRHA
jgi:uracil-DNA glycosylase